MHVVSIEEPIFSSYFEANVSESLDNLEERVVVFK